MAYMNQERKAALSPAIKAICKEYGVKATISVNNHSTLVLNISAGDIDFFGEVQGNWRNGTYIQVNQYYFQDQFTGRSKEFLGKVIPAMMVGIASGSWTPKSRCLLLAPNAVAASNTSLSTKRIPKLVKRIAGGIA